jgi:hypothetical protein
MDTTQQYNPNFGTITRSAVIIEKVHNCTDCPIRKLAVKQPKSLFARMHNWHKIWWPGWKAHQARVCPLNNRVIPHA